MTFECDVASSCQKPGLRPIPEMINQAVYEKL